MLQPDSLGHLLLTGAVWRACGIKHCKSQCALYLARYTKTWYDMLPHSKYSDKIPAPQNEEYEAI